MEAIHASLVTGASGAVVIGWCLVMLSALLSNALDEDILLLAESLCSAGIILAMSAPMLHVASLFVVA